MGVTLESRILSHWQKAWWVFMSDRRSSWTHFMCYRQQLLLTKISKTEYHVILCWCLHPLLPIYFLPQMTCNHSVDYKYQPIFDIKSQFHEFSGKNKGTWCHLVLDDYRNVAHQLTTTMEFPVHTLHTLMYAYSKSMTVRNDRDTVDSVLGKKNCVSIFIMIKWKVAFHTHDSVCHTDLNSLTT